jgi:hypothetical protein
VRECRAIPVYSSLLVRFYHYKARTRLRVQRAPGIPHALHFPRGERFINNSGALRVARANVFVEFIVIASEATQYSVIPGRCEASNPESRDSGSGPADHPGMTAMVYALFEN